MQLQLIQSFVDYDRKFDEVNNLKQLFIEGCKTCVKRLTKDNIHVDHFYFELQQYFTKNHANMRTLPLVLFVSIFNQIIYCIRNKSHDINGYNKL